MPTIKELESLVDVQYASPALPNTAGTGQWTSGDPFIGVQSMGYWSSSTSAAGTTNAWGVYLGDGDVGVGVKSFTYRVWPVRGGQ